jgi:hypothetical protein
MDYYTEDISKFGYRERDMLIELLQAWQDYGLPRGFYCDGVKPAFNSSSGYVFLVNEDYQVCMTTQTDEGTRLEIWHTLPYSGEEGFLSDLLETDPETLHADDLEYIQAYAPDHGKVNA